MSENPQNISDTVDIPSWDSLLLICRDCRRRKNGPEHLKATRLAKEIKHSMKETVPGARIALTTCLKLCPKKAVAVAYVTSIAKPRIAAIKTGDELLHALPLLMGRS